MLKCNNFKECNKKYQIEMEARQSLGFGVMVVVVVVGKVDGRK